VFDRVGRFIFCGFIGLLVVWVLGCVFGFGLICSGVWGGCIFGVLVVFGWVWCFVVEVLADWTRVR
jgi:hypothetical protein